MSYNNNGGFEDMMKQQRALSIQPPAQQPLQPENIHTLLNASVEKIAQGWIDELAALRKNTEQLESLLLAHVASTKANITRLQQLGEQIANEAARGREVCDQITGAIQQLSPPSA